MIERPGGCTITTSFIGSRTLTLLVLLALWSGDAAAARSDWPLFWRGRLDAADIAVLDEAYAKLMARESAAGLYARAAAVLERSLNALAPTSDRPEMQRRGDAWMFLGELAGQLNDVAAMASAEATGLKLIEASVPENSLDLAEALVSHSNTRMLMKQRDQGLELVRRAASICEQSCRNDERGARLAYEIGLDFRDLDEHEAAIPWFQRSLTVREKLLGPDHADTLASMRRLAKAYETLGRIDQALPLRERVLESTDKHAGPKSWNTVDALNDLALVYVGSLQYAKALPLFERALAITETLEKPAADETVTQLTDLVMVHQAMGNSAIALPLAQRIVEIDERVKGPEHRDTATALWMVGSLYAKVDHYGPAETALQRSLAIREKLSGEADLETAQSLTSLGSLYLDMGRYAEAEPLLKRSVAVCENVAGPEHQETLAALYILGQLYQAMGRFDEALPILERSVVLSEKVAGPGHPVTGLALRSLGLHYKAELNYTKALPPLQRSLAISEAANGPDHPSTVLALEDLGGLYVDTGQYAAAAPLLKRAVEIAERTTGPDSLQTANALSSLGHLYWTMGLYHDALPMAQRSLAIAEAVYGGMHPNTATAVESLGTGQELMGDYPSALTSFQRSLDIRQQVLGADHPSTAGSLMEVAVVHGDLGEYALALPPMAKALTILEKSAGPTNPRTAAALNGLAVLHLAMGQPDRALPLVQRSLQIIEQAFGNDNLGTANTLAIQAKVQRSLGHNAEALALTRRAREISEAIRGPEHPDTAQLLEQEAALYVDSGAYERALPIYQRTVGIAEKSVGRESPSTARGLIGMGQALSLSGKPGEAIPLLLRADGICAATHAPSICWSAEAQLSHAYRSLEQPLLATFWGKQAINTVQGVRAGLASLDKQTQQSFLDADKRQFYTDTSDLLLAQGRIPEAQAIMGLLKDAEYFDFVRRDVTANAQSAELPLTGVEKEANERFYAVRQQLAALGQEQKTLLDRQQLGTATGADLQRLASIEGDVQTATKAFDDFVATLEQRLAGGADTATHARQAADQLRSAQSLMAALDADGQHAAAVQYIVSEQRLHIIVTTASIQLAHDVAVTPTVLNARIFAFREAVQNPTVDPRPLGRELYATLIAPVQADLEAQHVDTLMLVLDDVLRYVPFAALTAGDRYLVEQYRLAIFTPGAESRLAIKDAKAWSVAAMGMTRAVPELGLPPLEAVVDELQGIVQPDVLPGTIRYDSDFDRAALQASLRTPVLHIASHFSFVPGSDESFLLLGDGSRLTLRDVRLGMRFDNVELLTLSACNTATGGGRRENGAEVEGLGRLAQDKGARAVLATLWPVADRSTGLLMREFYREHQQQKLDKAAALRAAQLALLHGTLKADPNALARGAKRAATIVATDLPRFTPDPAAPYAHPFFWAPFILMGNWL